MKQWIAAKRDDGSLRLWLGYPVCFVLGSAWGAVCWAIGAL